MKRHMQRPDYQVGFNDGLPIGLGYLTVSFAYGLFAAEGGMTPLFAVFLSLTNLTSAGQFAGTRLIFADAPYLEIGLTVLLVNLRYMIMSLSLSQKLRPGIGLLPRLLIGYGITDEVYAIASLHPLFRSFLYYVPYAVLAAMIIPAIFSATTSVWSATAGLIAALVLGWRGRSLLTVAIGASAVVFLVERLLDVLAYSR